MAKSCPGQKGHPPCRANFLRLFTCAKLSRLTESKLTHLNYSLALLIIHNFDIPLLAGFLFFKLLTPVTANLERVRLGSIRNKNNWNNASKRLFGSYSHSGIPGFHSGYSAHRSRIAGIYSGIHSYSGIFPNERALSTMVRLI